MKQILLGYGQPQKIVTVKMILYKYAKAMVRSPDGDTDFFKIVIGVLQWSNGNEGMKGYFAFPNDPALLEPHHQIVLREGSYHIYQPLRLGRIWHKVNL